MDRSLAERMLDAIESLYLENSFLKAVYQSKGWKNMERVLADARADVKMAALVREKFAPVRERILEAENLEQVLQEFLRVVPPKKESN